MSYWGRAMNRRDFLRKAWIAGAGMAVLSRLPKGLAPLEIPKAAKTSADIFPLRLPGLNVADAAAFAKQAQAICDAIKPAIDAIATLDEIELPKIGRVWFVGPHGDDANDGLTPESCLLSFEEGMKQAGREDELPMSA